MWDYSNGGVRGMILFPSRASALRVLGRGKLAKIAIKILRVDTESA